MATSLAANSQAGGQGSAGASLGSGNGGKGKRGLNQILEASRLEQEKGEWNLYYCLIEGVLLSVLFCVEGRAGGCKCLCQCQGAYLIGVCSQIASPNKACNGLHAFMLK